MLLVMNIVIMAGGGGTRLWPVSRRQHPKQFLKVGKKTLLAQTYHRARQLTPPQNIFIATLAEYLPKVRRLVPRLPEGHIFTEPTRRDTTAAFAAVALRLKAIGRGEQPTIFLWSDHVFTAEQEFITDLKKIPALLAQHPDSIIIMGHRPHSPETGLGYIELGQPLAGHTNIYQVNNFKEKPAQDQAVKFITAGNFVWNLGYFSFLPEHFLRELRQYEPSFVDPLDQLARALSAADTQQFEAVYNQIPKAAVEYTVIQKTPRILAVVGDYGWNDVGNWSAMHDVLSVKETDRTDRHIYVDAKDNFIYNTTKKMVSLIGLKDTIVVVTKDAILVTHKKDAHKVKDLVTKLENQGQQKYL